MTDHDVREFLERMSAEEPTRFLDAEPLIRRARRRAARTVVISAVGVATAFALVFAGASQLREQAQQVPINPPEERQVDLGIFAPVAGRIVYGTDGADSALWGIDPSAPSPGSTQVRIEVGGTADAGRFTVPLGWSSDGTTLLLMREGDRPDGSREPPFPNYLYILHADGTETQVTPEPVGDAAISPDGSRVAFTTSDAFTTTDRGLYVVDAEGGTPVRIAQEGASPTFSPDGTRIAYLSTLPGGISGELGQGPVWVTNADGSDTQEILAEEPNLENATLRIAWSPAGDRLAMSASVGRDVAIFSFAPDGSDLTEVISGGFDPHWSPDGSRIAYQVPTRGSSDEGGVPLVIADADGSNVQVFDVGGVGPWHPGTTAPVSGEVLDPAPSRFVGEWAATDYNDHYGSDTTSSQTMMIRVKKDGLLHVTVHDESGCSEVPGETAPQRMTGIGELGGSAILVVPSPDLTCLDGSTASERVDTSDGYTLVFDPDTDRIYDSLGVVWSRGAAPDNWSGPSTRGMDGQGTFSILHGEVTFRADGYWTDHLEAYIDPRVFFLLGPGDEGPGMTIFVNPLPPEDCDRLRVPPSAEALARATRSNPNLETTAPVIESVGGIAALRMDVVAAPGASVGPCTAAATVDVVNVPGRPWGNIAPGDRGRLYVLDFPGGSARTLAIWITAPDTATFHQAVDAAEPVLESFEFNLP